MHTHIKQRSAKVWQRVSINGSLMSCSCVKAALMLSPADVKWRCCRQIAHFPHCTVSTSGLTTREHRHGFPREPSRALSCVLRRSTCLAFLPGYGWRVRLPCLTCYCLFTKKMPRKYICNSSTVFQHNYSRPSLLYHSYSLI